MQMGRRHRQLLTADRDQQAQGLLQSIEAFGLAGSYELIRHFFTPLGAPKTVWRQRSNGKLLLLGSLPLSWPEPMRLEALLPWLNRCGEQLALTDLSLSLRRYHRSLASTFLFRSTHHRHFLATYRADARPCMLADGGVIACALADFHRLGSMQIERDGLPFASESLADLLHHWLMPGLEAAHLSTPPDLVATLDMALCRMNRLLAQRLVALDALPRFLIHGDWQHKNLLLLQKADSRGTVHILDSESCRLLPRLFDVYFLLAWDDEGRGWQGPHLGLARLRQYLERSGGLTSEERQLLPDLLMLKALSNAVWACDGQKSWRQRPLTRRMVFRNSLRLAEAMAEIDVSAL
jgi:hypothetical protein